MAEKKSKKDEQAPAGKTRKRGEELPDVEPASGSPKRMVIAAASLVLVGLLVMILTIVLLRAVRPAKKPLAVRHAVREALVADPDGVLSGAVAAPAPFVINTGSESSFFTVAFSVEFFDFEVPEEFTLREAQIRDAVLAVLGKKTQQELMSDIGREKLRVELLDAINQFLPVDNQAVDIFYTKYLLQ